MSHPMSSPERLVPETNSKRIQGSGATRQSLRGLSNSLAYGVLWQRYMGPEMERR
jgi:hypothetical protein